MADLVYKVRADYKELEVLRSEIRETVNQMKQFNQNTPKAEVDAMSNKYASLLKRYEDIMARVGRYGVFFEEAMRNVGKVVKESVEDFKDLTNEAEKRLAVEEKVNAALKSMRDDVKAQKDAMKASGIKESSQEWQAINEKLQVYENLLSSSNVVIDNIRNSISSVKESTNGIGENFNEAKKNAEDYLDTVRQGANDSIDKLNDLVEVSDKLEESLSNNSGKSFEDLQKEVGDYGSALQNSADAAEEAYKAQEAYIEGIHERLEEITKELNSTTDKDLILQLNEEAEELNFQLSTSEATLNQIKSVKDNLNIKIANLSEVKETINAFDELKGKLTQYGTILSNVKMGTDEATRAFENYANKTTSLSENIKSSLKNIAMLSGIAFGVYEIKSFISSVAETRTYFQDIESSMKVFLGSAEKAAKFTQDLKDYAWYNMFEFSDLAKASQQMIAYGQDVDSIIPKLDMLSNVAAGTHAPLMEMVDAYNRAKSTGVVDAMAIKSWATKGVVIKDILKEMGEAASGTQVTFEQLNQVLAHITGEGGMFHNLMKEQLNNISAEKGQLEDNLATMYNEIGEKLQGAITKWYKLQSDMVDNYQGIAGGSDTIDFVVNFAETGMDLLMEHWKELLDLIKNAIAIYGSWRVALVATSAVHKAQVALWKAEALAVNINSGAIKSNTIAKGQATTATILLDKATKAFNASLLASPLTWWTAGIAAVVYGIYSWVTAESAAEAGTRKANDELERQSDLLDERKENIENLIGIIKDGNKTEYEQIEAYKKLKVIAPEITNEYTRMQLAAMGVEEATKLLNKNLDDAKYELAKKNVEEYTQKVDELRKRYEKYQEMQSEGADYSFAPDYVSGKQVEEAEKQLEIYRAQLKEIEDIRWEANTPIEIKVQLAEESYAETKKVEDFYNEAMVLAQKVEDANNDIDYNQAVEEFEAFKKKVEEEIKELDKKIQEDPLNPKFAIEKEEKERMLTELKNMQAQWRGIFSSPIDVTFRLKFEQAKQAVEDSLGKAPEGYHWVEDSVTPGGKHLEEDKKAPEIRNKEVIEKEKKQAQAQLDALSEEDAKGQVGNDIKKRIRAYNKELKAYSVDNKSGKGQKEVLQRRQRDYDQFLKNREQQQKQERDSLNASEEARIAEIENGTQREREARKNQFRLTQQQLDEKIEAFKKANVEQEKAEWQNKKENKDKIWADSKTAQDVKANGYANIALTADQQAQVDAIRRKNAAEEKRYYKEQEEAQVQALRDSLKEYGDIQEQKLAIAEEYAEKIRKAEEAGNYVEAENLRQKEKQEVSAKEMARLKAEIDWEGLFNNLDLYSSDFLEGIRGKLQTALQDPSIEAADKQIIAEKLAEIDKLVIEKTENTFSWINDYLKEQKRLQEEAVRAAEEATKAEKELNEARSNQSNARQDITEVLAEITGVSGENLQGLLGKDVTKITSKDKESIFDNLGIDRLSKQGDILRAAFDKLAQAELRTAAATGKLETAEGKKKSADAKVEKDWRKRLAGVLGAFADDVNKYLSPLSSIADKLGLGDLSEKIDSGVNAVNSAAGAAASFATGDYLGAAMQGLDALSSFADTLGISFGGEESDKTYAEDMARLTETNQRLDESINRLNKTIQEGNIKEIGEAYEKQMRLWQIELKNLSEQVQRSLASYKSGGIFSSGEASSGYNVYTNLTAEEIKRLSEIFGIDINAEVQKRLDAQKENYERARKANPTNPYAVGFGDVNRWANLVESYKNLFGGNVISEILSNAKGDSEEDFLKSISVLRDDVEVWNKILALASEGHQDAEQYLTELADMGDKLREIEQGFVDSLSNISFDQMFNDYISNLDNLDEANKNFADTFEGYIRSAIIRGMAMEVAKPLLEKWQAALASYIKETNGKLTKEQINRLMHGGGTYTNINTGEEETFEGLDTINNSWKAIGETLKDLGLDKIDNSQQTATGKSLENISYTQADSLVGIATAQQIAQEQSRDRLDMLNVKADQVYMVAIESRDIAADSRQILAGMAIHVEEIRDGMVDTLVPAIKDMRSDLAKVRKLVEEQ